MPTKNPVLFIIFNRPDVTREVWEAIREAKPSKLYISADGPRQSKPQEWQLCQEVRAITEEIDWPCIVKKNFNEQNLGCRVGVSSAISWFFENEEQGIILEDDCLPSQDFFHYCDELLEYYKNDERVMQISGSNYLEGKKTFQASYYFSTLNDIWGWATWKRAWKHFSLELKNKDEFKREKKLSKYFQNNAIEYWFGEYLKGVDYIKSQVWSTQWSYVMIDRQGYTIVPNINLVQNIGFSGEGGTNATSSFLEYQNIKAEKITFPLIHPAFYVDRKADNIRFQIVKRTDPVNFYHVRLRKFLSHVKTKTIEYLRSFFR